MNALISDPDPSGSSEDWRNIRDRIPKDFGLEIYTTMKVVQKPNTFQCFIGKSVLQK